MTKRVFIKNFGCQMNIRDSEVICGLLKKEGYRISEKPDEADIVIFNTCSVRQHAEDKVWSEVGRIARMGSISPRLRAESTRNLSKGDVLPQKNKKIIGLVGCMAQSHKEAIFERAAAVDFVVGPSDIDKIPAIIKKVTRYKSQGMSKGLYESKIWETDGESRPEEIYHTGFYEDKNHAFVVISEGCSNFCSYCVVPYVRGPLHNRSLQDILREIKEAVKNGITRFTLLGQNVNAYEYEGVGFGQLLERINSIAGLGEFSFLTSHPKDTSVELFKLMRDLEKLKKHLHLPVQSGSDRILELMNRGYTRKFYLELVDSYRKIIKNPVLSTDVIVGFPTEKEDEFQDTYNLIRGSRFNSAYIFKYSPRLCAQAAKMADDVPQAEKERRHRIILDLQKKISTELKDGEGPRTSDKRE
ncbi:MAG: MiaB/RimO family radical SAM methylthiotransferase [Candidatus Omnitrophota bacterium]